MRTLKNYVVDNFKFYDNEDDYKLYKKFLDVINHLKLGIYQEKFENIALYFKNEDEYINHLMIFVVLVSINNNLLSLEDNLIKDIVRSIEDISCDKFEKYLPYLLSYENIHGLESIYNLNQREEVIPYQILKSMLSFINFDNDEEIILYNIDKYYKEMYANLNDNYRYIPWFNASDDFNSIYSIILKNMEDLNELVKLYKTGSVFSEKDFRTLSLLKQINKLPFDKQSELLELIKEYDEYPKPVQEKCEYLLNIISKYYELFKESGNIVYANFKR